MFKRLLTSIFVTGAAYTASAQQLIGLTTNNYVSVNQLQLNPAYVNNARVAPEFNLFSISALAGNNLYTISSDWALGGFKDDYVVEGKQFKRILDDKRKKAWVNLDITGPAFSFTYKKKYQFGVYTRFRTIVNAGNIEGKTFDIWFDSTNYEHFHHSIKFDKAGASVHAFGEIGISVGKMLYEDDMYKLSGGITIKYLMGFAAANLYTKNMSYQLDNDTVVYVNGDLAGMYTYNATPNGTGDLSQRAGKGSLGFDIGVNYHFFPDGDPNTEIPYRLNVAASITDLGSVSYVGDAGSAKYQVSAGKNNVHDYEFSSTDDNEPAYYLSRQIINKNITQKDKAEKFKIGLPTAFRLNTDYNFGSGLYMSINTLINLRGNGASVYKPSYISYINFTPRIDIYRSIKFAVPFTLHRYKDLTMGAIVYLGPLYVGSNSLSSLFFSQQFKNIDVFAGMGLRFISRARDNSRTFDNAYDEQRESFFRRLVPGFLRGEKGIACPPKH